MIDIKRVTCAQEEKDMETNATYKKNKRLVDMTRLYLEEAKIQREKGTSPADIVVTFYNKIRDLYEAK